DFLPVRGSRSGPAGRRGRHLGGRATLCESKSSHGGHLRLLDTVSDRDLMANVDFAPTVASKLVGVRYPKERLAGACETAVRWQPALDLAQLHSLRRSVVCPLVGAVECDA